MFIGEVIPLMLVRRFHVRRWLTFLGFLLLSGIGYWWWSTSPGPRELSEVYPGISYECRRYDGPAVSGLAHFVTIDLTTPGLDLFITPVNPEAVEAGWQYETRWLPWVVGDEDLAVAVNGTLFEQSGPWWAVWPGQWSRSLETIVVDGKENHIDPHSYLLWFDADLTPYIETQKPPSPEVIRQARWGISGQGVGVYGGKVSKFANSSVVDRRNIVGFDSQNRKLFFMIFDAATEQKSLEIAAEYGANFATALDSGDSVGLVFGKNAQGLSRKSVVYPHRSLATILGVRMKKKE